MIRENSFAAIVAGFVIAMGVPAMTPVVNAQTTPTQRVENLRITILSTMLAQQGIGEWGFSALVEADGHRILFDTGARPDTVLSNARTLGVDLGDVEEVVLTHNHGDHTGGLLSLRRELRQANPKAMSVAHVGRGIFWERPESNWQMTMQDRKAAYERLDGRIVEHAGPAEIHPGIWLTGPVPRRHPERNYGNPFSPDAEAGRVLSPDGPVEDNIPESLSMVINTSRGLVVISGCGHAGLVNTLDYAATITAVANVHAAIGGFHLLNSSDDHLAWTADKLVDFKVENFVGAHCTGLEPVYRFRELAGLDRSSSVVGAVGATFTLVDGIDPLSLAH